MTEFTRTLSDKIYWFAHGKCFRFPYRDPYSGKRKFLNCTPDRFASAGIHLPSSDIVRMRTKTAEDLARKLRDAFMRSLTTIKPGAAPEEVPMLSAAIEKFFELRDQSAGYRKTLRYIFNEFKDTIGDRRMDQIRDEDLKAFERRIAKRCGRTTTRAYLKQLGMLIHFALRKGWIRNDPRVGYKLPREKLTEPNPFSKDDLKRFFEVCKTRGPSRGWAHLEWLGTGLLTLGLRPVEAMFADWRNINWDERLLWIDKSHAEKEEQARTWVPIPLSVWPEFVARKKERGPIWLAYFGEAMTERSMDRARKSVAKQMDGFTWRRFRRTFASMLAESGNDLMIVSRLLRHSLGGKNISVAQKNYIGHEIKRLRDVVDAAFAGVPALKGAAGEMAVRVMEA